MWARVPRWAGVGAAALAAAVLLVWALPWGLSTLATRQLPAQLSQALGRPVSLGQARIDPWRLTATLTQLQIGPASGQPGAPLLMLGQVSASLRWWDSLRHRAPVVEALQLQAPQIHLVRHPDGRTSVDDLLQRLARPPAPGAADEPARWALYNLQVAAGAVQIDDQLTGQKHQIDQLNLGLPFLSNLPADVAVTVLPRLGFRWNGRPVQATAQALPFSATRQTRLALTLDALDLQPLAAYLPARLPLRLKSALLDGELSVQFKQASGGAPEVTLSGDLALHGVALDDAQGQALARWRRLQVAVVEAAPLARRLTLGAVVLTEPSVTLGRKADGRWTLQPPEGAAEPQAADAPVAPTLAATTTPTTSSTAPPASAQPPTPATTSSTASAPASAPKPAATAGAQGDAPAWQVAVASVQVVDGQLAWVDLARGPAAQYACEALQMQTGPLRWPVVAAAPVSASGQLRQGQQAIGRWQLEGEARPDAARLALRLEDASLAAAQPYLQDLLAARLQGQLAVQAELDWAATPGQAPRHQWKVALLQVDGLGLSGPGLPSASIKRLSLRDSGLDLTDRQIQAGALQIDQASLSLARLADGQLDVSRWWHKPADRAAGAPAPPAPTPPTPPTAPTAPTTIASPGAAPAPDWRLGLKSLTVERSRLELTDWAADARAARQPVQLQLHGLQLSAAPLAWPLEPGQTAAQLALNTRLGLGTAATPGTVAWQGQLQWLPWRVQGQLEASGLPVQLADRYAGTALGQLMLAQAEAAVQARIEASQQAAGWRVDTRGDLRLGQWHWHLRPPPDAELDDESRLLGWQDLQLSGLHLTLAPGARPQLVLQSAALQDLYARLVITEQGRLNLLDARGNLVATPGDAPTSAAIATAAAPVTAPPHSAPPVAQGASAPGTAAPALSEGPAAPSSDAGFVLDIGGISLRNGSVDFTDRFIRPSYSVRLTTLDGQLGRFRSDSPDMASLSLTGRAAGTALLDIQGQFNPAVRPPALDIRARATDLELAPLSPYAGKYAGYAIERGKLSMDVHYRIDPAGQLAADNQVVLNQLTFGERVESPEATRLPVLLAVALLKDSKGVIDINLPISGSLNDPQFSVGSLVVKVIGNLLAKAITAPFSLLTGGSGPDLSQVDFPSGSAGLSEAGTAAVAKVAKALLDRPALTLSITGSANPTSEAQAYRSAQLAARLQAEQRRGQGPAAAPAQGAQTLALPAGAERLRLLAALYRQAPLPDKPRNALGQLTELAEAEMVRRLEAAIPADANALRELALERAVVVRDALVAQGLPASRLFLAAPQLHGASATDTSSGPVTGGTTAPWRPRAELSLALP